MVFNYNRSTKSLQVLLPSAQFQFIICRWIRLWPQKRTVHTSLWMNVNCLDEPPDTQMAPLYRWDWLLQPCCTEINRMSYLVSSSEDAPIENSAASYYRQYYTDLSKHCAVCVFPSGGQPAETSLRCDVISLMTTLTGNPQQNTHS